MTEVEFQAGDELDGDLENEGFAGDAGAADENADATAVSYAQKGAIIALSSWVAQCTICCTESLQRRSSYRKEGRRAGFR